MDDFMLQWKQREIWKRQGKDFLVEVHHSVADMPAIFLEDGANRWFVYAYIYPQHPHFSAFDGVNIWQPATENMPLHGGCTFCRRHIAENGEVCSYQVGADYQHYGDDGYAHCENSRQAYSVFRDAEQLFDWLDKRAEHADK